MTQKIQIEDLPITDQFMRQRRLIQDRGELALIEDGRPFRHLGYFSLKPGQGHYRGGHYHLHKVEHFYLVSGRLRVRLADLESGEKLELAIETGQRVTIHPGCAHRFEALQEAQVIEYYDGVYAREDDLPFTGF
jgi:dTDP-4-dehydrorhamnose 3,5-epimerase-like enzyme